jgi:hypothetical protein
VTLTENEKHLLKIIGNLRGNTVEVLGRLYALKKNGVKVDVRDIQELEATLGRLENGAHLPHAEDEYLSVSEKHQLITAHRDALKKGKKVNNVLDLLMEKKS